MTITHIIESVPASYVDAHGHTQEVNTTTRDAVLEALSATAQAPALVCEPGAAHPELVGILRDVNGERIAHDGAVPAAGYFDLERPDGTHQFVISAPAAFAQPARGWGWAVQLYAARSRDSWGIGDFGDLATIARQARTVGATSVLISPVHASAPVTQQQASPYSPASRQWLQLLHIAIEDVPGAAGVPLDDLRAAGLALNGERLIDRDTVWTLKRAALERIWRSVRHDLGHEAAAWIDAQGHNLTAFAAWCVLAEEHDSAHWRGWPAQDQDPACVERVEAQHADRVAFFAWAQWVAHVQFAAACTAGVRVVADIAVGFDSSSADAWLWQDVVAFDFEVGCPPDVHNLEGQRWGLPALTPTGLQSSRFAPFIAMVRSALQHAGALRIDHVMQLWRLYWVPVGGHARDGAYVMYPADALLAILRLEAAATGAWVVGEDMGTVADGVREQMLQVGMLGYRAALRTPAEQFPELVMGASSTHDQATVAGTITGSDEADLGRIGKAANHAQLAHARGDLATAAGVDLSEPVGPAQVRAAVLAQHARLGASAARVVMVSLDDAAAVAQRPNMPGTVTAWPNWCLALPRPVEDVLDSELARGLALLLGRR